MKISSKAWHLRLCRSLAGDYTPKNLCRYFWQLFFTLLVYMVLIVGAVFILIDMIFKPWTRPIFLGWFGGLALLVGIRKLGGYLYQQHELKVKKVKPKTISKQPSIVLAFIKAKKARICPLIEVVDDHASTED